jgi:glycosyltransferase involved in cell wall biosynthesis
MVAAGGHQSKVRYDKAGTSRAREEAKREAMSSRRFSNHKLVHDFIVAFKKLAGNREDVVTEMEDFCKGYRDAKAEVWSELLALDVEKVLGTAGGTTLAATITHMKIKHGHLNKARA